MQSPSPAQVARHVPPGPQRNGLQFTDGWLHAPAPVQKPEGVYVEPVHEAAPQAVVAGATLQVPEPLHVPVRPQGGVGAQRACGSASSAGTSLQVPARPATLQALQVPQLELAQHTPSTQKFPVRQSAVVSHDCPSGFLSPQRFVLRSQMFGDAQLASDTQVVLQALPLQANGAQDRVLAARHVPAPSHVRASVCVVAPGGQDGATQTVPTWYSWHVPRPSQTPVVPQLAAPASLQVPVGSAPPEVTGEQVPGDDALAQDMHAPAQAVRQQTPWAQKPVAQSEPSLQVAPGDLSPHDPATQTEGDAQSASAVQVALQDALPQR